MDLLSKILQKFRFIGAVLLLANEETMLSLHMCEVAEGIGFVRASYIEVVYAVTSDSTMLQNRQTDGFSAVVIWGIAKVEGLLKLLSSDIKLLLVDEDFDGVIVPSSFSLTASLCFFEFKWFLSVFELPNFLLQQHD